MEFMPFTFQDAIGQLLSYNPLSWLVFVSLAAGAAYWGRWRSIIAGHFAVALLICYLDAAYQNQHKAEMDTDAIFALGVIGRVLLINTVLLPVSASALFASTRRRKRTQVATNPSDATTEPPAPKV